MAMMLIDQIKDTACKTAEADAIRAKTGDSAQLAYDWANNKGFADAIAAIPSGGGGDTLDDYLEGTCSDDYSNDNITTLNAFAFYRYPSECSGLKHFNLKNATSIGQSAFYLMAQLQTIFAPKAGLNGSCFYGSRGLETAVVSGYAGNIATNGQCFMRYATPHLLKTVDMVYKKNGIAKQFFKNADSFDTLILREAAIFPLGGTDAFDGTPFASGGTGGTIYIPKTLYDHLGDNSANDYKAATNWSTVNGYGTITWAKIEGSIYENAYADGTPIS